MKVPLFLKIFLGHMAILAALAGSILAMSYSTIRENYIATRFEDIRNTAIAIKPEIIPLLAGRRDEELDGLVKKVGRGAHMRITVILPDGRVVADSEKDPRAMENHRMRPEVDEALKGTPGESMRFSSTIHEEMMYAALPLVDMGDRGSIIGVLRLSIFFKDINRLLALLRDHILLAGGILSCLSLVLALIFSRRVSRSIKDLDGASRRIAAGDFNARIFLKTHDELRDLADSFNVMAGKVRELFSEADNRKEELQNILGSLQEGLVVIDGKDRIRMANASFTRAYPGHHPAGRLYWEIVRDYRFGRMVQRARKERGAVTGDIEWNGRTLSCAATSLPGQGTVIVTCRDVTEMRRMDQVKRDLVTNASHELRTPLTAIKGYLETILDDPAQYDPEHLSVVKKNTDRLINIVEDLLTLSRLEDKSDALDVREVDLGALVTETLKIFDRQIRDKGLMMDIVREGDIPALSADPFMLEQMLVNLIDNAVKYTDRGGIAIGMRRRDGWMRLEVRDTGIGIPKADLSRIFERFYVVDKSRSRKLGGTGLGLAIVKHIVLLHNGTIEVDSTPGVGSTFIVSLPLGSPSEGGTPGEKR